MAIQFTTASARFDETAGPQKENAIAHFNGTVRNAAAAINGWSIEFTNGDHPIRKQRINIVDSEIRWDGNTVTVPVSFLLRDNSGNVDDPFTGYVDVMVVAEVN